METGLDKESAQVFVFVVLLATAEYGTVQLINDLKGWLQFSSRGQRFRIFDAPFKIQKSDLKAVEARVISEPPRHLCPSFESAASPVPA